jgi:cyclophilin family peptidyl-prolyl cis-trans isomerase
MTCENFRGLCKGHTTKAGAVIDYSRTEFTRIVKGKFIQGGDIKKAHAVKDGDSASIFESGEFPDESFHV